MDKRYFGTKRQNDSGEILRDFLNTVPVKKKKKKFSILRKRKSKWTYAELCERVKAIDERLFADKDAFI